MTKFYKVKYHDKNGKHKGCLVLNDIATRLTEPDGTIIANLSIFRDFSKIKFLDNRMIVFKTDKDTLFIEAGYRVCRTIKRKQSEFELTPTFKPE